MKVEKRIYRVKHNIAPVYDNSSKVLILGSFPSVKSREQCFFYGHPQNRFWKVISQITESEHPQTVAEKSKMLLGNSIAVWDVVGECDIIGSQDNSILNVVPNAIDKIIKASQVKMVFLNGKTAYNLYKKYVADNINIEYRLLPSTSPANATWSLSRLIDEWSVLKDYIK